MAEAAGKIARGELMTTAIELTHEQLEFLILVRENEVGK
jgi:hypothetical protein